MDGGEKESSEEENSKEESSEEKGEEKITPHSCLYPCWRVYALQHATYCDSISYGVTSSSSSTIKPFRRASMAAWVRS